MNQRRTTPDARLLGVCLALVLETLTSCEMIPRTPVEGEDDGALLPSGRLSWELPDEETDDRSASEGASSSRLELEVLHGSGGFTQQLEPGQTLQVGDTRIEGPGEVDVSADLWVADLAAQVEQRWPGGLGLGGRFGLRFADLQLRLRGSAPLIDARDGVDLDSLGLMCGLEGSYEPTGRLRLHVAGSLSWGLELSGIAAGYEHFSVRTLEAGASWALLEHVRVLAGWRRLDYEATAVESVLSDLELTLSGPFVGLWVSI